MELVRLGKHAGDSVPLDGGWKETISRGIPNSWVRFECDVLALIQGEIQAQRASQTLRIE